MAKNITYPAASHPSPSPPDYDPRWPTLYPELLENISDRLPLHDFIAFRHVCRSWRAAPSGRADIADFETTDPWLLVYEPSDGDNDDDNNNGGDEERSCKNLCRLYSFSSPECCTMFIPDLRDSTCLESSSGWLLAHREKDNSMFFYNPLTFRRVDLPKYPKKGMSDRMCTFTSLPTSRRCIVFIIYCIRNSSKFEFDMLSIGSNEWISNLVETGMVWLDGNKSINTCSCEDHDPSHCFDLNTVLIYEPKNITVRYNYMTGKVSRLHELHKLHNPSCVPMFHRMMDAHSDSLLAGFQEDEVDVSVCQIKMKMDGSGGIANLSYKVVSRDETKQKRKKKSEPKKLKAVWFEPRFEILKRKKNLQLSL